MIKDPKIIFCVLLPCSNFQLVCFAYQTVMSQGSRITLAYGRPSAHETLVVDEEMSCNKPSRARNHVKSTDIRREGCNCPRHKVRPFTYTMSFR